jgi:hypothetical protein
MSTLRTLLQEADPLRHEVPPGEAARERIRQRVLQTPASNRSVSSARMRVALVAAFAAAIVGAVALGDWLWQHGSTTVAAAVRFELRLAEEQPLPGLIVAQLPDSGGLIYLHQEVLAGNDDVAHSWVSPDGPDGTEVVVQFMPPAAQRIQEATRRHIGRRVAILIDGTIVMAPVVRSPIADSAVLSGTYTKAEAERIARGIEIR